jgi:penicillin-binding protein 1A
VPLRQAFAQSLNTVSVQLAQEVGFRTVADMAQRLGITTRVATHPSMALGASEVRLIDMTRAYASVSAKGVAVTPYGIRRVTTADGHLLYQHPADESRVLFTPWIAAEMTDLLQTAVMTGSGRAANIGRPVAGKTGTTTSNKDGWFLGFSSGLTTGIWMGRDDNRTIPGLQGGRAPARAFHDFMIRAVANRPIENFETEAKVPDWQQEPDEEVWFGGPDNGQQFVDPDGNPLPQQPPERDPGLAPRDDRGELDQPAEEDPERLDQQWLDRAVGRERSRAEVVRDRRNEVPPPRRSGRRDPVQPGAVPPEP